MWHYATIIEQTMAMHKIVNDAIKRAEKRKKNARLCMKKHKQNMRNLLMNFGIVRNAHETKMLKIKMKMNVGKYTKKVHKSLHHFRI